ncbi:MAG: hypothetical protein MZU91_09545 [Desulfosudis oleivorans]|nr:hypothetical protein [Desulfosudis oleivorans]
MDTNFENDPALLATGAARKFRFSAPEVTEAVAMANRVTQWSHDHYGSLPHYRGGKYTTGFWSMSHACCLRHADGRAPVGADKPANPLRRVSRRSPSPRRTCSTTSATWLQLDPVNLNNNIAFNVKVVPCSRRTRARRLCTICSLM